MVEEIVEARGGGHHAAVGVAVHGGRGKEEEKEGGRGGECEGREVGEVEVRKKVKVKMR